MNYHSAVVFHRSTDLVQSDSEISYFGGQMSEITIFFDIYAKFRCILIPVMIYMIVLFPSRNITGGGSGNSGGTIKILLQKLNLREKSPRTHTMYRWLAKICERTQCFCKITISCRMILKRRTFEIGMSKTTIFFEFYTKFKHIFIPEVISWHYLVFPPEYLWKRQVREFWWDNQNLTPEMKSARKITPDTYCLCIGDLSTYVNIYRVLLTRTKVLHVLSLANFLPILEGNYVCAFLLHSTTTPTYPAVGIEDVWHTFYIDFRGQDDCRAVILAHIKVLSLALPRCCLPVRVLRCMVIIWQPLRMLRTRRYLARDQRGKKVVHMPLKCGWIRCVSSSCSGDSMYPERSLGSFE